MEISRNYENMEVCMVNMNVCMCPNMCSMVMLDFVLYYSCAYGGIYIRNERWMNLMEYGNIGCSRVVY